MASFANVLSIEAAMLANSNALLEYCGLIIKKIQEIREFREECKELLSTCIILSLSYLEHEFALNSVRSGKDFGRCLRSVYRLVSQCTEKSVIHTGWEVVIRGRVATLRRNLTRCQATLNTEILVSVEVFGNESTLMIMQDTSQHDFFQ